MREQPVYLSGAEVARRLGFASRAAVYNAWMRGRIRAAAMIGDRPVFDEAAVAEWRANRYKRMMGARP